MGSENALSKLVKIKVPNYGHYVRIENSAQAGTPDVWLGCGLLRVWIELKHSHKWPARAKTIVRLEHLTKEQRAWLIKEGLSGGCAAVLWQVGREYLIFPWWEVGKLGSLTRQDMYALSIACTNRLNWLWLYDSLNKCRIAI